MVKLLFRLIGAVFVIVGVAAPIGGCYLLITRKAQVDFYIDHVFGKNTFSSLSETRKTEALEDLDKRLAKAAQIGTPNDGSTMAVPAADSNESGNR